MLATEPESGACEPAWVSGVVPVGGWGVVVFWPLEVVELVDVDGAGAVAVVDEFEVDDAEVEDDEVEPPRPLAPEASDASDPSEVPEADPPVEPAGVDGVGVVEEVV